MAPKSAGSVGSYGKSSEGSSVNGSETSIVVIRGDDGSGDLLSRGNGSRKEALFSVMYLTFAGRILESDWRFLVLSTLYTWVQLLNLIFGPNFFGWDVDWEGNNWWRFYKRLLLSNAAVERGWGVYAGVVLVFIVAGVLAMAIVTWLNHYMKSRTKLRWKWPFHLLRVYTSVLLVFNVSFISLLTVSFTCNDNSGRTMFYFPDKGCLVMPQVILFVLCLAVEVLMLYPMLLGTLIDSGDTNYYSHNFFSASVGSYIIRLNLVRMALPLVPVAFQLFPKWQAFFNFVLTSYYLYITIRRAPMHRTWLNCVNAFLALFPWWAASLAFIGVFYHEYWHRLTTAFLAGMFPLGFACAGITYWRLRFIWGVAERFKGWTPRTPRRDVYRFWDEYEVEMVARVCRKTLKTKQLDMIPDPYYTSLADKVVQAGLIQFPDSAFLNIVYASLQAVLLNDPSGGSAQLQKARKCGDITWVQRFQVYVREQDKLAQKGKDSNQSVTFDAATWTEFTANYKSVIRTHRNALGTLKAFWHLLLRADVSMVALVRQFLRIPASKEAAERAYKALMERYPNNPKVLRAYSRFLQQVKNDPHSAARFAALANKVENQQEESWRDTVFGQLIDRKYLDDKSTRTMAMIDETLDAVVMINSEGMIQFMNQPALTMFGYRKGETEGCNVNILLPGPINQQHDSFLRNYMTTRQPRVLNRTVEVVGLHKEQWVFPVDMVVTPIMIGGTECFLGVLKPLDDDSRLATVYCHASGTVLCINRGLSNLLAYQNADIIGRNLAELTTTPEKTNQIIAETSAGEWGTHDFGRLLFTHKFGEEINMKVSGRKAGTESVNCCVLEMSNEGNAFTGLVAVSKVTGRITYANTSFCEFVGVHADQLIKMRLHEILAEPYAMLHNRWIKGRDVSRAPGLRCRAGRAVEFKHGSCGKAVAALLEITDRATEQGDVFSVKVAPLEDKVDEEWNRISLTVAQDVIITSQAGKLALFGLEKEVLVGKGLDALLDVYRKEGKELAATHAKLLRDLREQAHTLRVAVAPHGKRLVPAVLEVVLPNKGAQEGPATIHLYRADCLEGVLELDAASKVKRVSDEAALIFGIPASSLVGEHIQKVLPKVCPGGRTTELLAVHGQRGGSKQKVGASLGADGVHPDKHALHVSLQAAESTERPGRYLVRIIVPKPISAYSTINRPGTTAPGLPAGMTTAGMPARPGIAGSLRSFFNAGGSMSRPGTGGACPVSLGATGAASNALPSLRSKPTASSSLASGSAGKAASRAGTASECPFTFGSKAGGSREASLAATVSSRPATGGSACPLNLNSEEVHSSLSFPPSSRLAIGKAHMEESARRTSAGTDTTALATAVAAAAVAAAVPTVDTASDQPQQEGSMEDAGRDPNIGYNSRGEASFSGLAQVLDSLQDAGNVGATAETLLSETAVDSTTAGAERMPELPAVDPAAEVTAASSQAGPNPSRPSTSFEGRGLVFAHRPDGSHSYDQSTAAFRFKQLSTISPQRQSTASSRARLGSARPQTGSLPTTPAAADPSTALLAEVPAITEEPQLAEASLLAEQEQTVPLPMTSSDPAATAGVLAQAAEQVAATDAASPAADQQAGITLPDHVQPAVAMEQQPQTSQPALPEATVVPDGGAGAAGPSSAAPGTEPMSQPGRSALVVLSAVPVADGVVAAMESKPSAAEPGGTQADALTQDQSVLRSMTASEEEAGEGGAEEDLDPAELAAKMDGVKAWLDASAAALPQEQAAPAGPDSAGDLPTGVALLELPVLAPSRAGLPLKRQVSGGLKPPVASIATGQLVQPSDRGNVESSSMGESDTGSLAPSDADDGADYSRLRRFKKAYKLLNSTRARQAIDRLRIHLRFVLLFLVCAHVAFFAAALVVVNGSLGFILNIDKAGVEARNSISACTDLLTIKSSVEEIRTYGHNVLFPSPQELAQVYMLPKVLELEATQNFIYFSKGSAAAATTAAYDGTMLNVSVFLNVDPYPFSAETQMSLWDATQRLVNSFKDVAAMTIPQMLNMSTSFSYRFALDNSPEGISAALLKIVDMQAWLAVGKLKQVGQVTWILLGIEAGFVIPLAAIYVSRLLYQVAVERFNLFSIFLFIPRPAVLALARAEIVVDELDDSEDDEEDMGVGADAAAASGAISTGVSAKVLAQKAAQNRLAITRRSMVWLMLPFAVWLVVVGVLWSVQDYLVSSSVERVMALDLSERGYAYMSRMWFFQNSLVNAASTIHSNTDTAETLHYRQKLVDTTKHAQYYYELLLYGEDNPYRHLNHSMNQAKLDFPELEFSGTMFTSVPRNKLLYDQQCLRLNQSSCLTKDNIMYWTANMGLNNLMYYSYEQSLVLAQSPTSAIFVYHPTVWYTIMTTDDSDGGWLKSNQIFMDVGNFGTVRAFQGVVLAFIIVGSLAYLYFLAAPFVRLTLLESRKVAEVLSYLPRGVDIASLLESANISSGGNSNIPGKAVKRRTSSQSADVELDD